MTRPIVELCNHGEAKPHGFTDWPGNRPTCPGGRVLEQAIIIERDTDGTWPMWALEALSRLPALARSKVKLDALASAQKRGFKFADIDPPSFFKENDALASAQENQP